MPGSEDPPRNIVVTFGRPVTDEDLELLKETADVIETAFLPGFGDEDHDHVHIGVKGPPKPVGDPAF
jgi:hypothetical protein